MACSLKNKRVLGVDLGMKRTGLALSDELGISVRALKNLTPKSRLQDIDYLVGLCLEYKVRHIVVGYALMPQSGQEGIMGKRAAAMCEILQETLKKRNLSMSVHLMDESYTSKMAAVRLVESDIPKKKRKQALDSEVARILVEDFLAELAYE